MKAFFFFGCITCVTAKQGCCSTKTYTLRFHSGVIATGVLKHREALSIFFLGFWWPVTMFFFFSVRVPAEELSASIFLVSSSPTLEMPMITAQILHQLSIFIPLKLTIENYLIRKKETVIHHGRTRYRTLLMILLCHFFEEVRSGRNICPGRKMILQ